MLWMDGKWTEAIAMAERAIAADPSCFLAHIVQSRCCSALARITEAVESNRRALAISPHGQFHSELLFEMNYLSETTSESLYAEARCWDVLYASPLKARIVPHQNDPDPDRPLRIGYVSPDLYHHAMMNFLPAVFERHDRSRFELFAYSVGANSDEMTERLQKRVEHYTPVQGAENIAERVRVDRIDILVDLAGHTMGPHLLAFALKPAPVQVSWLGVLSTTGMSAMDYFLGDPSVPCSGGEEFFSETVYRLPRPLWCYRPLAANPVAPPPCLERGYLTFGCFNNPKKITREVVRLWSRILHGVPRSRLLLQYRDLDLEPVHRNLLGWFSEERVAGDRVRFRGQLPTSEYLAGYGDIDVALDPFPYNGGTTTLDALWMGVPVVTLAGTLPVQRAGASILSGAGLTAYIASTADEYFRIALSVAATIQAVPTLRRKIREALEKSPLMDERGFIGDLEQAYRKMWRAWCRSRI